ncbi:ComEA family DNA-binding protein [Methylobacterium oxalidis]|nr:helix-hairpin-helix domain-containing protein [Methylobacterium oxalidis]
MNHPPQQPVRPSSVLRVPLPAQTPGVAPSLTAEAMRQASPGLQTAAVQVRPQVAVQAVPTTVATVTGKAQSAPLVGLNTATLLELRRLPHIVKSQARAIISSRPYSSVAELAERKLVSARAYKAIRTRVDLH